MEAERIVLPPEVLMPRIEKLLEVSEAVPLTITGGSMNPFMVHGRDTVFLSKPNRPLKRGDMIFYRRDNGYYVLHRICRVNENRYCLVGDAQDVLEPGIRDDQVIALVTAVRRKGKLEKPGTFWWEFFEKIWINLIPVRRLIIKAYGMIHR